MKNDLTVFLLNLPLDTINVYFAEFKVTRGQLVRSLVTGKTNIKNMQLLSILYCADFNVLSICIQSKHVNR